MLTYEASAALAAMPRSLADELIARDCQQDYDGVVHAPSHPGRDENQDVRQAGRGSGS
jgi:hypothetical protein